MHTQLLAIGSEAGEAMSVFNYFIKSQLSVYSFTFDSIHTHQASFELGVLVLFHHNTCRMIQVKIPLPHHPTCLGVLRLLMSNVHELNSLGTGTL